MGVVAAVPVTLMRLCWGVRACGYPVSCHVDHSGGSPGPFPSRGGVWGSAEHPRVLPQLELLEVRRQQEEEERKRRPPSPEPSTKVSEETESQQQW